MLMLHTLSHFQAKKKYITFLYSYVCIKWREREQNVGFFREIEKETYFSFSFSLSSLCLFASGNKRKKLLAHLVSLLH